VEAVRDGVFSARAGGVGCPGLLQSEPTEISDAKGAQSKNRGDKRQFDRRNATLVAAKSLKGAPTRFHSLNTVLPVPPIAAVP
jgi:hypothetical protein